MEKMIGEWDLTNQLLNMQDLALIKDRVYSHMLSRGGLADNVHLLFQGGVVQPYIKHKTVELRFRQRIGSFLFYRILGGQYKKRCVQMKCLSRSRHVILLRSEEHTSELQSRGHLVCRLLLEKKK